jgi:hypothetical protein
METGLQQNIGIVTDNLQPNVSPSGYVGSTLAGSQSGFGTTGFNLPGYTTGTGLIQGNIPQESRTDRVKTGTWEFPDQRMSQVSQTINTDQTVQPSTNIPMTSNITTNIPRTSNITEVTTTQFTSNIPTTGFGTGQQIFNTPVYYGEGFKTAENIASSLNQNLYNQPQTQQIPSTGFSSQNLVSQGISSGLQNQPNWSQNQPNYSQNQPNYSQNQPNWSSNIPSSNLNTGWSQNMPQTGLATGLTTDVSQGMASFGKGVTEVSSGLQSGNLLQPGMAGDLGTGLTGTNLTNVGSSGTTLNQPSLLSGGRQGVNPNIKDIHTNLPTGSSR